MLFSTKAFRIDGPSAPLPDTPETPETPQSFNSFAPVITPVTTGLDFFKTEAGVLKLTEGILGILTTFFIAGYCHPSVVYSISLVIISFCIFVVLLLIFFYIHSLKLFYTIRQSLFETSFNTFVSLVYLVFPTILLIEGLNAGVIVVTLLGVILCVTHAYDAYKCHIWYRQVMK